MVNESIFPKQNARVPMNQDPSTPHPKTSHEIKPKYAQQISLQQSDSKGSALGGGLACPWGSLNKGDLASFIDDLCGKMRAGQTIWQTHARAHDRGEIKNASKSLCEKQIHKSWRWTNVCEPPGEDDVGMHKKSVTKCCAPADFLEKR